MNTEDLKELTQGFGALSKAITTGEATQEEVKTSLDEVTKSIEEAQEEIRVLLSGEKLPEGYTELDRSFYLEIIKEEQKNFSKKELKEALNLVLSVAKACDKDIQGTLFSDYIMELFGCVMPVMEQINPKAHKVLKKFIKKNTREVQE